jgi:hypothetical protein
MTDPKKDDEDDKDGIGDSEPDMDALPVMTTKPAKKKKGGKVMMAEGKKPKRRLDKAERS